MMYTIWSNVVLCTVLIGGLHAVTIDTVLSPVYRCKGIHRPLIIISFDGFRHDYLDIAPVKTPNFDRLKDKGASGTFTSVFETKTFPNHHSLATGLYPETHGVLSSHVYDTATGYDMHYGKELWSYNQDVVTPIWTLNQLTHPHKCGSGVMMWPGSEFPYRKNIMPTFHQVWNKTWSWETRFDMAISWLFHAKTPASLIMVYFEEPDMYGHAFGPDSKEIAQMITKIDQFIGYMLHKLELVKLDGIANVFIVSDHGMSTVVKPNLIDHRAFTNRSLYKEVGSSPVIHVFPHEGKYEIVLKDFQSAAEANAFQVYTKDSVPTYWHVTNSSRSPPIMLVANPGFAFVDYEETMMNLSKTYNFTPSANHTYGIHGYDSHLEIMKPLFFAFGPNIRNITLNDIEAVDFFLMWCALLKLNPTAHNGTYPVDSLLFGIQKDSLKWLVLYMMSGLGLLIIMLVLMTSAVPRTMMNYYLKCCDTRRNDGNDDDSRGRYHIIRYIQIKPNPSDNLLDDSDEEGVVNIMTTSSDTGIGSAHSEMH